MGELVLMSGQRPRGKVPRTLQTAWTWTQKSWFVPGEAFAGGYFISLSEPPRASALALKGLIWTFLNCLFFPCYGPKKMETMPSGMKELVTLMLNRPTTEDEASAAVWPASLYAICSQYLAELLQILCRVVHAAMRHCGNPATRDSLVSFPPPCRFFF